MTTARDIIFDAFEKIGVYAPGETVQDSDANRALIVLQNMHSAWVEEYLYLYELLTVIIPTVQGQNVYTIGDTLGIGNVPLANIFQPRPPRIQQGPSAATASSLIGTLTATTTAPLEYPIIRFGSPIPAGVVTGSTISDQTNPGAIAPGTTVVTVGTNQITMSQGALGLGVQVNDVIVFGTPPQPVNTVSTIEWQNIEGTNLGTGLPDTLYYDPQYPLGFLNLSPIPAVSGQVIFQAWRAFPGFVSLNDPNVTFTAGTEAALKGNLAVMLKSYFNEAVVPPAVVADATYTKDMLRYTNLGSRGLLRRGLRAPAAQPRAVANA